MKLKLITINILLAVCSNALAKEWAICTDENIHTVKINPSYINLTFKDASLVIENEPCLVFKELKEDPKEYLLELERTQDQKKLAEAYLAISLRQMLQKTRFGLKEE